MRRPLLSYYRTGTVTGPAVPTQAVMEGIVGIILVVKFSITGISLWATSDELGLKYEIQDTHPEDNERAEPK